MWEMFDDMKECNKCGGVLGPPPKFTIPPPPRSPYLGEYRLTNCNEEDMSLSNWQGNICETMPIFDTSLYSSRSLQTLVIIAVFTLLLVLIVLISSLFVWKKKRKVQNLFKTPPRSPHINRSFPLGSSRVFTYEDPDIYFGHRRPLVMGHIHNVDKMLRGKVISYPTTFPMTSPLPFLVTSTTGSDQYHSKENVYEELGNGCDSDGESGPSLHLDGRNPQDDLSLSGERFFNKDTAKTKVNLNVSTIYHECTPSVGNAVTNASNANGFEKKSAVPILSNTAKETSPTTAIIRSQNTNQSAKNSSLRLSTAACYSAASLPHTTSTNRCHASRARDSFDTINRERKATDKCALNASSSTTDANVIDPLQKIYDKQSNLMSLGYIPQHQPYQTPNDLNRIPFYSFQNKKEHRNLIKPKVTNGDISWERINYPNDEHQKCLNPNYTSKGNSGVLANLRSLQRRDCVAVSVNPIEPSYGYAEPIDHNNCHFETCGCPATLDIATTKVYSNQDHLDHNQRCTTSSPTYHANSQLYSGENSSFGSDSGYSQYTPDTSIGRHDYDMVLPALSKATTGGEKK